MIAFLLVLSGLMGAAGVVLAAASAHMAGAEGLASAADMLLFHAVAVVAVTAARECGLLHRTLALLAGCGFVLGAALFSGDVALRAFAQLRLFPMAAPTGGTLLILTWLTVAAAALAGARRN